MEEKITKCKAFQLENQHIDLLIQGKLRPDCFFNNKIITINYLKHTEKVELIAFYETHSFKALLDSPCCTEKYLLLIKLYLFS